MSDDIKIEKDEQSDDSRLPLVCPVCGEALVQEKCKLVCRSKICVYRIVFNCAEF